MRLPALVAVLLGLAVGSEIQAETALRSALTTSSDAPCVYLDETQTELTYQVDMFSRTLDPRHWTNVKNIEERMRKAGKDP